MIARAPACHTRPHRRPAVPGFLSVVLSAPDGRRQLALMVNALNAPDPVYKALTEAGRAVGAGLLARR